MFYPPGDATALAKILDSIAADPRRLNEYRRALPAARARMSWSQEKLKYVAMLRELAGEVTPVANVGTLSSSGDRTA
jgi:hypothetical protein